MISMLLTVCRPRQRLQQFGHINTNPFFDTATSSGGGNSAIWFSSPVGSTNQNHPILDASRRHGPCGGTTLPWSSKTD